MRLRALLLLLLVPVFAASCKTTREREDEGSEEAVTFSQTPAAVQASILRLTSVDSITELERDTENGVTVYDVEYTKDGETKEVSISTSGKILKDDDADDEDGDDDDEDDDDDDDEDDD